MGYRRMATACLVATATFLSACASNNGLGTVPEAPPPRLVVVGFCPQVEIRLGAQAYTAYQGTASPANIRYQASIQETARECTVNQGVVNIHVGVAGRFIAGPRGTGNATARLRIAVVQAGDQVVFQQVYTVSANVSAPTYGGDFAVVEEAINIPVPPEGTRWQIIVGFDQN